MLHCCCQSQLMLIYWSSPFYIPPRKYSKDQDNVIFPRYRAKCDQLLRTNSRATQAQCGPAVRPFRAGAVRVPPLTCPDTRPTLTSKRGSGFVSFRVNLPPLGKSLTWEAEREKGSISSLVATGVNPGSEQTLQTQMLPDLLRLSSIFSFRHITYCACSSVSGSTAQVHRCQQNSTHARSQMKHPETFSLWTNGKIWMTGRNLVLLTIRDTP
ncbi:uncharacterized protein LOC122544537 [Chiloscyllium plagiosum]|uniref:uncharacterized protein LOC122544537 n=1 Tax=Chiloscyllium plagiosum TaxID=36176 RepID=UPI001CB8003C|nr:uncharacterized protein LOC122544537 [Chiloscyllium plagiosum]